MEVVERTVKSMIPEITDADVLRLVSRFAELGVCSVEHLFYVQESDIIGYLKPIQIRLLIDKLRKGNQRRWQPGA